MNKMKIPYFISRLLASAGDDSIEHDDLSLGELREGVFGGITNVSFEYLIISFVVVLCIIISLERGFDYLHKKASDANQLKLFNKMQRELVLMGMISFGVFIVESAVEIDPHGDWFFSFEIVHILIVFMGFAFLFQAFFLMDYAHHFQTQQLKALRKTSKELLVTFDDCSQPTTTWIGKIRRFYDLHLAHQNAEYKILKELFVQINPDLPAGFNFSAYIGILFHEYISELGDVSPYSWLFLACIVCVNGFKNGVIDPATHTDYFEGVHMNTMRYGIVVAFMLSTVIGIQTYFSYRYYYKVVRKGIKMVDCFGSGKLKDNKLCTETYKACLQTLMDRDHEIEIIGESKKTSSRKVLDPDDPNESSEFKFAKGKSVKEKNFIQLKKEREEREFRRLHTQLRSKHVPFKSKVFNYYRSFIHLIKNIGKAEHNTDATKLHNVFLFSSPKAYFFFIECILLLQCFYVATYWTQLVPVASDFKSAGLRAGWIIGLTIPVFVNLFLVRVILTKAVILLGIYELHHEAFSALLDQEISEESMKTELRAKILDALGETGEGKEHTWDERKKLIQDNFDEFDYYGTGEITKDEFRELLGHLHIYLSQRKLDLLWSVLDYDLSCSINVDELFAFIFPISKDKLKDELSFIKKLREKYKIRMLDLGIRPTQWEVELKKAFESFDLDNSGYIDEKEIKGLVCWVDKELGLSKEVKTMYYALEIADHRRGISWSEVTKLFSTSSVKSQWLESINRVKKYIFDELEGLEILDIEKQIDTIKDAFESSITNNACRKRRAVKHFKHMLFLAEVEINPNILNKFLESIELESHDNLTWEEVYSLLFATENTDGSKKCLDTIKKKIIESCSGSDVLKELKKNYFDRFDEDNSNLLDLYEFKALLKCLNINCSGSFLLFILSAKNFWDNEGMLSFDKLAELVLNSTPTNNPNPSQTNITIIEPSHDVAALDHVVVGHDV